MNDKDKTLKLLHRALTVAVYAGSVYGAVLWADLSAVLCRVSISGVLLNYFNPSIYSNTMGRPCHI